MVLFFLLRLWKSGRPYFSWLIGCKGGATTFACKSKECPWQDRYICFLLLHTKVKKAKTQATICLLRMYTTSALMVSNAGSWCSMMATCTDALVYNAALAKSNKQTDICYQNYYLPAMQLVSGYADTWLHALYNEHAWALTALPHCAPLVSILAP